MWLIEKLLRLTHSLPENKTLRLLPCVAMTEICSQCVIPFLCEAAPKSAHAGKLCTCSREFTRRVIKRCLIKNWYKSWLFLVVSARRVVSRFKLGMRNALLNSGGLHFVNPPYNLVLVQ